MLVRFAILGVNDRPDAINCGKRLGVVLGDMPTPATFECLRFVDEIGDACFLGSRVEVSPAKITESAVPEEYGVWRCSNMSRGLNS
jgi:hypothetical protein